MREGEKPGFVALADCGGVNTLAKADFKLPIM